MKTSELSPVTSFEGSARVALRDFSIAPAVRADIMKNAAALLVQLGVGYSF